MGLLDTLKGFGSHEFAPFATAPPYAAAPPGGWTASARTGGLDSQPECPHTCTTWNFKWLRVRKLWLNPALDSSDMADEIRGPGIQRCEETTPTGRRKPAIEADGGGESARHASAEGDYRNKLVRPRRNGLPPRCWWYALD